LTGWRRGAAGILLANGAAPRALASAWWRSPGAGGRCGSRFDRIRHLVREPGMRKGLARSARMDAPSTAGFAASPRTWFTLTCLMRMAVRWSRLLRRLGVAIDTVHSCATGTWPEIGLSRERLACGSGDWPVSHAAAVAHRSAAMGGGESS